MSHFVTRTVRLRSGPAAMVVEVNRQERQGWAVRHIVSIDVGFIVVFEKEGTQ